MPVIATAIIVGAISLLVTTLSGSASHIVMLTLIAGVSTWAGYQRFLVLGLTSRYESGDLFTDWFIRDTLPSDERRAIYVVFASYILFWPVLELAGALTRAQMHLFSTARTPR